MDTLPLDLIGVIWAFSPITDKRHLLRTCKSIYKKFQPQMPSIELAFQSELNKIKFLGKASFTKFYVPLYKFAIELVYDNYAHLVPDSYVTTSNYPLVHCPRLYYQIGLRNNLVMLQDFLRLGQFYESNLIHAMRGAAYGNHVDLLEWGIDEIDQKDHSLISYAAKGGHFNLVKKLHKKGFELCEYAGKYIAASGNIEQMRWFVNKRGPLYISLSGAAKHNHMPMVEYLLVIWADINIDAYKGVGQSGNIEMVDLFMDDEYSEQADYLICEGAAKQGHAHILEHMLNTHKHLAKGATCATAIMRNHLNCVKWCIDHGTKIVDEMCILADENNKEMIDLLKSNMA